MKRRGLFFVLLLAVLVGATGLAFAQWGTTNRNVPRDGACFYLDGGYSNQFFCLPTGQSLERLPRGFNDQITAVRLFGHARVVLYDNERFRGTSQIFDRSLFDLRNVPMNNDSRRLWNDRVSSVRVEYSDRVADDRWGRDDRGRDDDRWGRDDRGRDDDRWNRDRDDRGRDRDRDDRGWHGANNPNYPVWGRGAQPRQGACFFRDRDFQGDYFCLARGQNLNSLPAGFNDRISSVRLFGGARVAVFQDREFRGREGRFRRDIADLHDRRLRDDRDHTWNDRISSIQVD